MSGEIEMAREMGMDDGVRNHMGVERKRENWRAFGRGVVETLAITACFAVLGLVWAALESAGRAPVTALRSHGDRSLHAVLIPGPSHLADRRFQRAPHRLTRGSGPLELVD